MTPSEESKMAIPGHFHKNPLIFPRYICAAVLAAVLASGCNESIRQYVELGEWYRKPDNPMIISGQPDEDLNAYRGSFDELSEADWRALERVAPRPIWQKIADLQETFTGGDQTAPGRLVEQAGAETAAASAPEENEIPPDMATTMLPNGKMRIFYPLRNYGGPTISTKEDRDTQERSITKNPTDLAPLAALIGQDLGENGTVTPMPNKNALVITCVPEMKDSVLTFLAEADRQPNQVEITARIFEVSHDFDFQYGAKTIIQHIASDNKQGLATAFSAKDFANAVIDPLAGNVVDPGGALRLMQVLQDAGITLDATFEALASTGLIKVVAAPRMTVDAGQTASMEAGQELPIETAIIRNEGRLVTQKLVYKPIGVKFYITPQAVGTGTIKLHVITSLSAISGFSPLPTLESGFESHRQLINPTIDTREAETYVTISDGNTLVIGGMKMVRTVSRESKVPWLGDTEALGWLFKNQRSQKQVNDLYFFVTPKIIQ